MLTSLDSFPMIPSWLQARMNATLMSLVMTSFFLYDVALCDFVLDVECVWRFSKQVFPVALVTELSDAQSGSHVFSPDFCPDHVIVQEVVSQSARTHENGQREAHRKKNI